MRTTAKVEYAIRAGIELARAWPGDGTRPKPLARHVIAERQGIPSQYLDHILADLRRRQLVGSARGSDGGYWLNGDPSTISMADVIRAVEGPLADVRGERPELLDYPDDLAVLQRAWIATRISLRRVLEEVTLADLRDGRLDPAVEALTEADDAWVSH